MHAFEIIMSDREKKKIKKIDLNNFHPGSLFRNLFPSITSSFVF